MNNIKKVDPIYYELGDKIKLYREKKDMTQAQLAESVQLDRTTITNIEKGKHKMFVDTLLSFCDALDVHPNELISYAKSVNVTIELDDSLKKNEKEFIVKLIKNN